MSTRGPVKPCRVLSAKRIIDLLVISLSPVCYRRDFPIIVMLATNAVCILIVERMKNKKKRKKRKKKERTGEEKL